MNTNRSIAYFSMEIALAPEIPTYSGGLGVLAGDTIRSGDAASLYDKLESAVLPAHYENSDGFGDIRRDCIALNGSFFNTQRMLQQYVLKAYFE